MLNENKNISNIFSPPTHETPLLYDINTQYSKKHHQQR